MSELKLSLLPPQVFQKMHLHLGLHTTLQQLLLYDFQLEISQVGRKLTQAFEGNHLLPGVILTEQGKFAGMISRRRFLESMSRPFGLEVFSKRPISDLYRFAKTDKIITIPGKTSILEAAKLVLKRSAIASDSNSNLLDEPLVVEIKPQVYRLLDIHQLLVAQSQIHELAIQKIYQLNQQLEQANQELQKLATVDCLTQTANRHRFDEYLQEKWRQLIREQAPLSLIMCDIDFFKRYNDTYGHLVGDDCLQKVAIAIMRAVKRPEDLVARYGGEEFAVILPHTNVTGAAIIAARIQKFVRALEIAHASSTVSDLVTISIGISSTIPQAKEMSSELIAAADQALYEAKANGRDRYVLQPLKCV